VEASIISKHPEDFTSKIPCHVVHNSEAIIVVRISKIHYIHDFSKITALSRFKPIKQLKQYYPTSPNISANHPYQFDHPEVQICTYTYPKPSICADLINIGAL